MTTTTLDGDTRQLPTLPGPADVPDVAPTDTAPASAPDAPPADELPKPAKPARRSRAAKSAGDKPAPRSRARRAPAVNIAERMSELYAMTGALVMVVPSGPAAHQPELTVTQVIGAAVVEAGPAAGDALAKLADDNPRVREALERVLTVSAFGGVVAAHLPIVVAAGLATGAVPPFVAAMLGGQKPEATPA